MPPDPPRRRSLGVRGIAWVGLFVGWAVMAVVVLLYAHHYIGTGHLL